MNLIMPGNPRYQPKQLIPYFGYDNLYKTVAEVELATLQVLGEIGVIPPEEMEELTPEIIEAVLNIPTTEVDKVEREITHHDIRAWVRIAQEIIGERLARWVHIPLTSYDPLDTGRMLQFHRAYCFALKPSIQELMSIFAKLVRQFADQIQIGRTHGQHALPITVGFWLATTLYRVIYNASQVELYSKGLCGKIGGAVGAHNAQIGLGFAKLCGDRSFEQRVLEKLDLKAAPISTQILPPEPLGYFLFSLCMLSASLAQFGQDCRNLMRSEIAEVIEFYAAGAVGSSTMAQKRNPINFENLVGMWIRTKNEFGKVLDTLISEHQRDLVGSSVARDFPIILINVMHQLNTLLRKDENAISFLEKIRIDEEACQRNFDASADLVLAEPLYIALQMAGYIEDAHELVNRKLVPLATEEKISLLDALEKLAEQDETLGEVVQRIPDDIWQLLHYPEEYTGDAQEKALEIALLAEQKVKEM
ncbi:MAG: lyase family protein [Candidatus Doudnabacteria bacterium]